MTQPTRPIEAVLADLGPPPRTLPPAVESRLLAQFNAMAWKFARRTAARYPRAADVEDYYSIARMAVIEAARLFDADRGLKFVTYAYRFAWGRTERGGMDAGGVMRVPSYMHYDSRQRRRIGGKHDTAKARALHVQPLPAYPDGADAGIEARPKGMDPGLMLDLAAAISTLDSRERRIITRHFALGPERRATLAEIGDELGITKERVRQIEMKALDHLRHQLA